MTFPNVILSKAKNLIQPNTMDKKVLLMILDGWGEGRQDESNVIYTQGAPYIEGLRKNYPMSTLKACGEAVGLPEGQMGSSCGDLRCKVLPVCR